MNIDQIIEAYSSKYSAYEALASRTASLLDVLAKTSLISVHIIESRVKSIESLKEKVRRPGKSYSSLEEITDLAGVRVICYYQDDCERISKIIEKEFKIEENEDSYSVINLSEDRFGYLSLHKIAKPALKRSNFIEWGDVSDLCCEIQVRTVIQHAWAAVSHQVQYKVEDRIPSLLKRRLNRIAGLFELADEQFIQVREEKEIISRNAKNLIKKNDLSFDISPSSVEVVINKWSNDNLVSDKIKSIGFVLFDWSDSDYRDNDEIISNIIDICQNNSIKNASDLLSVVGGFNEKYMSDQFNSGDSNWSISITFAFFMHIIRNVKNKPIVSDLMSQGWSASTAEQVLAIAERS